MILCQLLNTYAEYRLTSSIADLKLEDDWSSESRNEYADAGEVSWWSSVVSMHMNRYIPAAAYTAAIDARRAYHSNWEIQSNIGDRKSLGKNTCNDLSPVTKQAVSATCAACFKAGWRDIGGYPRDDKIRMAKACCRWAQVIVLRTVSLPREDNKALAHCISVSHEVHL